MPKPSVALWRAKPITRVSASATSPLPRRLADGKALGEVVETDACRDHEREPGRRREPDGAGAFELGGRGSARTEHLLATLGADPTVVVDEAHQPDPGAEREQRSEPRELEPRPPPSTASSSASSTGTTPWANTS